MTRAQLFHDIRTLSSGTVARLINDNSYKAIESAQIRWLDIAADIPEKTVQAFYSWGDFYNSIIAPAR